MTAERAMVAIAILGLAFWTAEALAPYFAGIVPDAAPDSVRHAEAYERAR